MNFGGRERLGILSLENVLFELRREFVIFRSRIRIYVRECKFYNDVEKLKLIIRSTIIEISCKQDIRVQVYEILRFITRSNPIYYILFVFGENVVAVKTDPNSFAPLHTR